MRRRVLGWMAATMWIAVLAGTGCDRVCDAYCDEAVATIEDLGCLSEWGVTWEDQNYADATEYLEHCQAHFQARIQDAGAASDGDSDDVQEECSDLLANAQGAEDCSVIAIADY